MIEVFSRELEHYFDFRGGFDKISVRKGVDGREYGVYLTDIKRGFLTLSPNSSVIIKELSEFQAENYRKLLGVWNPYLEVIYGVLAREGAYISVNEFVEAPRCLNCENRSLNLEESVARFGCLPERMALALLWQLCEAVKALEKIHLTHGDISPGNILLADAHEWDGLFMPFSSYHLNLSVKLADFGISKEAKERNHSVTTILGTKPFAAPEILDYRYPSDRVDIYSLGCVLHYMITGKSPKEMEGYGGNVQIGRGIRRIIEGCTSAYSARYRNAAALQKDIIRQFYASAGGIHRVCAYIPGFRSWNPWKMAVASVTYVYFGISVIFSAIMDMEDFFYFAVLVVWFSLELMLVFDIFHLGDFSRKYMEYRRSFPPLRYVVKFLIGFSLLIIFSLFFAFK